MSFEENPMERLGEDGEQGESGRNVTIHAIFMRHGEKELAYDNPETGLTQRGREQSVQFGGSLQARDAIKTYSSKTDRTSETAKLVADSSPTVNKMRRVIKQELGFEYDKDGGFARRSKEMKNEILGADFTEQSEEERSKRLYEFHSEITDYYLSFGSDRPDPNTDSPVESAAKMAKRVDRYVRMADKLNSGSDIDLINVSHDFNIAAFLREVIVREVDGRKVRGFESIKDIGGSVAPTDHFEVVIKTNEAGSKVKSLLLRGNKYDIDEQGLEELVKVAGEMSSMRSG